MTPSSDRFLVLTGGPGSGKTTLINASRGKGFAATEEAGRGVIREEMRHDGAALPCPGATANGSPRKCSNGNSAPTGRRNVSRALSFSTAGCRIRWAISASKGWMCRSGWREQAWRLRYGNPVFVAPPWKEIFGQDEERRQSWQLAMQTYETMVRTYMDFGYMLVELPRVATAERFRFVLETLAL